MYIILIDKYIYKYILIKLIIKYTLNNNLELLHTIQSINAMICDICNITVFIII